MDIIFKSEFIMTLDRYLYFCNNPVGEEAKRKYRAWKSRNILSFILSLLCALIFAILKDWVGIYILLFSSVIFLYRLLYQRKKLNTNQYNSVRKSQESDDWIRTTTFTDVMKVKEGNTESVYEYSYIKKITEDNEYFYLWHNSDFVIRIPQDSFVIGAKKDFKNFIADRIYENRVTS
ncbi:YcxB family protein [Lacrimispora defluvii]|uniref:YcxB family protein n=1 Tax=Lacrimispora defluvii TaxID=2719233 RepID=A0ABX1VUF7_9FIRM|nr:YcxB family protein [Lacrimispora defluvii]NNJ31749.1 YcxB family protein [Lacrimispora defluvii]